LAQSRAYVRAIILAVVFLASVAQAAGATIASVEGSVILARGGADSLYLWDASPYVKRLVDEKQVGSDGLHMLEATAMTELTSRARSIRATHLRIKVLYSRTGAVSKAYGGATFAGVEDVVNIAASRKDLLQKGAQWAQQLLQGLPISGVAIEIAGKLPPAQ